MRFFRLVAQYNFKTCCGLCMVKTKNALRAWGMETRGVQIEK